MNIHNSHSLLENSYNTECRNCWACSCHSLDIFEAPCDHSVAIAANMPRVVEAVERQAALYGAQISNLKNNGTETDILRVKESWFAFMRQFNRSYLARISSTAYHAAH